MAKETVHFRDSHPDDGEGEHAYEEERGKGVVVIRSRLAESIRKAKFLSKHKAGSIIEAVQKSKSAAQEFMEHVSARKGFCLDHAQLCDAIQMAVEKESSAAQVLLVAADSFSELLGQEAMRKALYSAVFGHKSCKRYFMEGYKGRFTGVVGAAEAYLAIERQSKQRTQIIN